VDVLWLALGLMLLFEGLMPMLLPARWRQMFSQLLQMQDGQIRFFGIFMVLLGLAVVWLVG